jgi:hypothetical protein
MRLTELFSTSPQHEVVDVDEKLYSEVSHIGGREVIFECELNQLDDSWEIAFHEVIKKNGKEEITNKKTGSGSELQVFSFIIEAIKRFIKKYKPEVFYFSATDKEPSRAKLYQRLVNRWKVPNYKMTQQKTGYNTVWTYEVNKAPK